MTSLRPAAATQFKTTASQWLHGERARVHLLFYLGVPSLTALLFGLNQAGMARHLPPSMAVPYWLGLAIPLWLLLDLCTRGIHLVSRRWHPHRWLVLLGGALAAMALISPYVAAYGAYFAPQLPPGTDYRVNPPFPEAFLDLRRFVAYSGVPIYWGVITLFFATYFKFPTYLVPEATAPGYSDAHPAAAAPTIATNEYGLPVRTGFRALLPYHPGDALVSLSSEDHYVRVITDHGNALVRYRFSDAVAEVRDVPGIQVHRSHWVAIRAIARVYQARAGYRIVLHNGTEMPVSRTNVGVLRAAGLL